MTHGSAPVYRFSGVRGHTIFGLAAGAAQVIRGVLSFRRTRKHRGALDAVRAGGNAAGGLTFMLAALSARGAGVSLESDGVAIDLGWWWRGAIPYDEIAGVEQVEHPWLAGFGVRSDLHSWLALVLWGRRVPALIFDPPRRLPIVWFLPVTAIRARQLRLGLEDGAAFEAALRERLRPSAPFGAEDGQQRAEPS